MKIICSKCQTPRRDPDQEHPGVCVCGGYLDDVPDGGAEPEPVRKPVRGVVGTGSAVEFLSMAMALGTTVHDAVELQIQKTDSTAPAILAAMGLKLKTPRTEKPWNAPKRFGWLRPKEIDLDGPKTETGAARYSALQAADGRAYTRDNADGVVRHLIKGTKGKAARKAEKAARRAAREAEARTHKASE